MRRILLIIQREYTTRVRTKSFILTTLLVPLASILLIVGMIVIAINSNEKLHIAVKDDSKIFEDKFRGLDQGESLRFHYEKQISLMELRSEVKAGNFDGVLYIPEQDLNRPAGIRYYSPNALGPSTEMLISDALTDVIKEKVLEREGYDSELISKLDEKVTFESVINDEAKSGDSAAASGVGYVMAFIIYIYLFVYGTMVMKGVAEEKTSRIVEVMLSSVKPFELMMGKIIGIGLVGLTQFVFWFLGLFGGQMLMGILFAEKLVALQTMQAGSQASVSETAVLEVIQALGELNFPRIIVSFIFYFGFGYLFYGAQFAAIGAATTDEGDTSSYTFPISMPIVLAIVIMNIAIQQPGAPVAVWSSMIPFFSPVVMMARIPFEISIWEQLLSMLILAASSIGMVWLASRIYRVGILTQGKKVGLKDFGKWIFSKY